MKLTVISHFWNEEFLLPFWLKHNREIFDHGIMIDYDSTDRSVEIIRELVPTWEIIKSVNRDFDGPRIDVEVMKIERKVSEWKAVLNTTEFLVCNSLHAYLKKNEKLHPNLLGFSTTGINMVDPLHMKDVAVNDLPLIEQRHYGYFEIETNGYADRQRLIHKAKSGGYEIGRHKYSCPSRVMPDLFLFWYGWSPMKHIKSRRLAIQTRLSDFEYRHNNFRHVFTEQQFEDKYLEESSKTFNILERIGY